MKKTILCLLPVLAALLVGCEKDLPVYSSSDGMLNFAYEYTDNRDSIQNYSFVYEPEEMMEDTIWFEVTTMGFPQSRDRYYEVEQILTGENDAIPGKHYVDFNDAQYKSLLCVPANAIKARMPVVVLRDASLKSGSVTLKVAIKPGEDFKTGYIGRHFKRITITDQLTRPNLWTNSGICAHYFGEWSLERHRFMIDVTGYRWDDDFLGNTLYVDDYALCDQQYLTYLANILQKAVDAENARREEEGLAPLADENGQLINFPMGM